MRYLLLLAALLAPAAVAAADLILEDAWVRALPPTQSTTAAYLRIRNPGDSAVTLVGVSSPRAGAAEIHTTLEVDGMMRMQRVPQVAIAPGQAAELAPGGMHVMLFRLQSMPREGEQVELCLEFEGLTEPRCTQAQVLRQPPRPQ